MILKTIWWANSQQTFVVRHDRTSNYILIWYPGASDIWLKQRLSLISECVCVPITTRPPGQCQSIIQLYTSQPIKRPPLRVATSAHPISSACQSRKECHLISITGKRAGSCWLGIFRRRESGGAPRRHSEQNLFLVAVSQSKGIFQSITIS